MTASAAFRLGRLSAACKSRLLDGFKDLHFFCGGSLQHVLAHVNAADEILSHYVLSRHDGSSGARLSLVKHTLLCCQHVQTKLKDRITLRGRTCASGKRRELQNCGRLCLCHFRPSWLGLLKPMPTSNLSAYRKAAGTCLQTCWNLELGLLCLLRPGKLPKLKHCNVTLPGDFTLSQPHAALRIASPKNIRHFGQDQFVFVRNPNTIAWLKKCLVEGSGETLWEAIPAVFVKFFKQLCSELKLSHW